MARKMVGGVSPGKGGQTHLGLPVFNTVLEAKRGDRRRRLASSTCRLPAPPTPSFEAIDAEIPLIVCITEGIPVLDMVRVKRALCGSASRLVGPNCPGRHDRRRVQDRHHAGQHLQAGSVGIVSRSGTLTYEAVFQTTNAGLGQTTAVGIGGDPVKGMDFIDVLEMFLADRRPLNRDDRRDRRLGRGGGRRVPASRSDTRPQEPVVGFIAGRTAPAGRRMGHAGAIIAGGRGGADDKIEAMKSAGIRVCRHRPGLARPWSRS